MRAQINIEMDNAAFEEAGAGNELARILRELAERIDYQDAEDLAQAGPVGLRDYNGNTVGRLEVTPG